jgi:virginiamycin B lyase
VAISIAARERSKNAKAKISRETTMRRSIAAGLRSLFTIVLLTGAAQVQALAQAPAPALTGKVTAEQGALEGVLVSAKKDGSNITVTVVSDKDGRYSFPAARLEPGQYAMRIRAIGFDLDNAKPVTVAAGKTATADLTLRKTEDLASQMSNAEWMASIPGTDAQKGQLLNCVGCHTLERPLRSTHKADDFLTDVLPRMQAYGHLEK